MATITKQEAGELEAEYLRGLHQFGGETGIEYQYGWAEGFLAALWTLGVDAVQLPTEDGLVGWTDNESRIEVTACPT